MSREQAVSGLPKPSAHSNTELYQFRTVELLGDVIGLLGALVDRPASGGDGGSGSIDEPETGPALVTEPAPTMPPRKRIPRKAQA